MKNILVLLLIFGLLNACDSDPKPSSSSVAVVPKQSTAKTPSSPNPPIPNINSTESPEALKHKIQNLKPTNHTPTEPYYVKKVNLSPELSPVMIAKGKETFENNCKACHTLTGNAPSKAGSLDKVLKKHTPAWFINMTTAVQTKLGANSVEDARLNKCPTRKYETRLSFIDSRDFLELLLSLE